MRKDIAIFIPAYNEERSIASVVLLAKKYGRVVVVDDGSSDRTAQIARACGARVVERGKNGGYGAAVKTAFGLARGMKERAYVFIDGDFQHDPGEIPRLAGPVLSREADVCLGSRFLGKVVSPPPYRKEGVMLINGLSGIRAGVKSIDFECGFRALSKKAIALAEPSERGYAACSEVVVLAIEAGLKVVEVPVSVQYFGDRAGSPIAQGAGLAGNVLNATIKRKPLLFFAGSGLAMLLASALLGIFVAETYYRSHVLATGSAFLTVFTGIVGLVLLSIGINIYTLETLLEQRRGGASG